MGWNAGYTIMEAQVIALYDKGVLTAELLDTVMEPYKYTDCDEGGSKNLKTKDGLPVELVICKVMKPDEYQKAIDNPDWKDLPYQYDKSLDNWANNEKLWDLYWSIWNGMWEIC